MQFTVLSSFSPAAVKKPYTKRISTAQERREYRTGAQTMIQPPIKPSQSFTYEFVIRNSAGSYNAPRKPQLGDTSEQGLALCMHHRAERPRE